MPARIQDFSPARSSCHARPWFVKPSMCHHASLHNAVLVFSARLYLGSQRLRDARKSEQYITLSVFILSLSLSISFCLSLTRYISLTLKLDINLKI